MQLEPEAGIVEGPLIRLASLTKVIGDRVILDAVDVAIDPLSSTAFVGPSGSGKSTLLAVLALLTSWNSGRCYVMEKPVSPGAGDRRQAQRRLSIGWVPQLPLVLPGRSVLDNVTTPLRIKRMDCQEAQESGLSALKRVGLDQLAYQNASVLSGGELQRMNVARAIVSQARLNIADEPTASLDASSTSSVFDALRTVNQSSALVLATHDMSVAQSCDRIIRIVDGRVDY